MPFWFCTSETLIITRIGSISSEHWVFRIEFLAGFLIVLVGILSMRRFLVRRWISIAVQRCWWSIRLGKCWRSRGPIGRWIWQWRQLARRQQWIVRIGQRWCDRLTSDHWIVRWHTTSWPILRMCIEDRNRTDDHRHFDRRIAVTACNRSVHLPREADTIVDHLVDDPGETSFLTYTNKVSNFAYVAGCIVGGWNRRDL